MNSAAGESIQLTVERPAGRRVRIESSHDLEAWEEFSSFLSEGEVRTIQIEAGGEQRFFRIVESIEN